MKRNEAFSRDFERIGDIFDIFEKSEIDFEEKIIYNNNCCADDTLFCWENKLNLTRIP